MQPSLRYSWRCTKRLVLLQALGLLGACLLLPGCAAVGRLNQLDDDYYQVLETNDEPLRRTVAATARRRFYVEQLAPDTLLLTPPARAVLAAPPASFRYALQPGRHVLLMRRQFDFDIFTLPFKIRPGREGLPLQLNTTFNAALYLGRRLDFYHLNRHRSPSGRTTPLIRTTGIGYGLFTGLGSTLVTPDFTRQHAITDYEGMVLHAGGAFIYDARIFNVGVAAGFDHLLGADGPHWVYQHKPWVGLLFGLDLN
jgi:hypothetical protein